MTLLSIPISVTVSEVLCNVAFFEDILCILLEKGTIISHARSLLTKIRVRIGVPLGNQIHSSNLWTLGIPKMYLRTLGYNVQISVKKFPTLSNFSVKFGHCNLGFSYTFLESPGSID